MVLTRLNGRRNVYARITVVDLDATLVLTASSHLGIHAQGRQVCLLSSRK